jgi:hypothetical protein
MVVAGDQRTKIINPMKASEPTTTMAATLAALNAFLRASHNNRSLAEGILPGTATHAYEPDGSE